MRVLVDTNVFVSYLLSREPSSSIRTLIGLLLSGSVTLLLPGELVDELLDVLLTRPYFTSRITAQEATDFIASLRAVAEALPAVPHSFPAVVRDQKDDYLIAYAVAGRADYLVTGDRDLLALGEVSGVRIATPAQFLRHLETQSEARGS